MPYHPQTCSNNIGFGVSYKEPNLHVSYTYLTYIHLYLHQIIILNAEKQLFVYFLN